MAAHASIGNSEPVERLPHGQAFEVEVVDRGSALPPDDVVMHYRFHGPEDDIVEETEPLKSIGGPMLAREGVSGVRIPRRGG